MAVIDHNTQRKGKTLWTQNQKEIKVKVYRALSEQDEARFIADTILDDVAKGQKFSDHAILYRMNAQSEYTRKCAYSFWHCLQDCWRPTIL